MRDVSGGWIIRYMHSTGASFFFIVVYLHMFRGLIYGSYKKPRELVWIFGSLIFLALMAEAFMGYLLPWGQMSFWGAQVIINLFSAIPVIGPDLSTWIRGDFNVSDVTLNRFFALHVIAVPIVLLGLVVAHIIALHEVGSNNPDGVEIKKLKDENGVPLDGIPFHPYYTVKDILGVVVFLIVFCFAAHLQLKLEQRQQILETFGIIGRMEFLLAQLESELDIMQVEKRIRGRVKRQMEKSQREYYLNEQVKAIQKELGEEDERGELDALEAKIKEVGMTKEAEEKCLSELKKLKMMPPMSAESTVVRNYIDTLLELPWKKKSRVSKDIAKADLVLNADHYGLEKVKERILEYLAVQKRMDKLKGPILCLVGPPGVGKTSLGESIAKATGRQYVRMALGGVRDESEIRGHRRTYIGSMPGKILQNMAKAGVRNPLFLLDEIDKLGSQFVRTCR